MKLKTFQAQTMADALAAVRKDLGPDAMILHTRSFKVGSWLGFGGKNMVEITASAAEGSAKLKRSKRPEQRPARQDAPDDRSLVLGGETVAAKKAARSAPKETTRDSAEIVVQRATDVVEPKPILSQSAAAASVPARRSLNAARPPIATRLPRREGGSPVRLSDATPPLDHRTPEEKPSGMETHDAASVTPPNDRASDPTRVLDGFRRPPNGRAPTAQGDRNGDAINEPKPQSTSKSSSESESDASRTEAELKQQIAGLEKMMGRVLESTRRTSIAVGKVSESAAEPIETGPLLEFTNRLVENDAPIEAIDAIIGSVRDRLDRRELEDRTVVRQAVLREIENSIQTKGDSLLAISSSTTTGSPRVISLIGPTGVGKTTTVAKLAAACKLRHGKRVGLITSDTYRIAAVEQLRTYAGIIGLPIKVVMSPEEMSAAIESLQSMDVIIVDTAGRSQNDGKRLDELKAFIKAARPDETHLVLSSTVGNRVLERTNEKFSPLSPDRVILTKLDEAVCTGHLAGLTGRLGLPLSFITVGQEVPDDIEPARADRLARVALDGPDVLFGGSDGRG